MSFEVNLSENASTDVQGIVDYLVDIDVEVAIRTRQGIVDHIGGFRDNPHVGEIVKSVRNGVLRESRLGSYRIFFTVKEKLNRVDVLRVRHVKRRSLKSLE